jgi:hypothetical protein
MGLPEKGALTRRADSLPRRLQTVFEINREGIGKADLERLQKWSVSKKAHDPILQRILRQQGQKDPNWPEYVWGQWQPIQYSGRCSTYLHPLKTA